MSKEFDQETKSHLQEIAEKLWNEQASLMVGAGFSKNASEDFPDGKELIEKLYEKLSPDQPLPESAAFPKIAQEYEDKFGKADLEKIITESIPDRIEPSSLHKKILELPWQNIFTTNYDTLLERASEESSEYRHSIIRVEKKFPFSKSPRIIKLHGCLSSNSTLIITKKDYEEYINNPDHPFTIAMKYCLMTNILCLVGFSVEDPNFLNWRGWVLNNLKKYALNIYLITTDSISENDRKHFRNLKIEALSLAEGQQYGKAVNNFIKYMLGKREEVSPPEEIKSDQRQNFLIQQNKGKPQIEPDDIPELIPILLLGGWESKNKKDIEVVSKLYRKSSPDVFEILTKWKNKTEPIIQEKSDTWSVISRENLWEELAKFINDAHLDTLKQVTLDVLKEFDKRYDLPSEERYLVSVIFENEPQYSDFLKANLATTLAFLSINKVSDNNLSEKMKGTSMSIIYNLLKDINDWKSLASIAFLLPTLAEAEPDIFLKALEQDLEKEAPLWVDLFEETDMWSMSPHTSLIWALEHLVWEPRYFSRSVMILAKLVSLTNEMKTGNKPLDSLRNIFIFWGPQTRASFKERMKVLRSLLKYQTAVGWKLLMVLLPRVDGDTAFHVSKPQYRKEWYTDYKQGVTPEEYRGSVRELERLLLEYVQYDRQRWVELIKEASRLLSEDFLEKMIGRLKHIKKDISQDNKLLFWHQLRDTISRHRFSENTKWVLPANFVNQLAEIYESLTPDNIILRYSWLFSNGAPLIDVKQTDWQRLEKKRNERRLIAVKSILEQGGLSLLLDFIKQIENTRIAGEVIGQYDKIAGLEESFLEATLTSKEKSLQNCGISCVEMLFHNKDDKYTWVENVLSKNFGKKWSLNTCINFTLGLSLESKIWDIISNISSKLIKTYWQNVDRIYLRDPKKDCELALNELMKAGRPEMAFEILTSANFGNQKDQISISGKLLIRLLNQLDSVKSKKRKEDQNRRPLMDSYIIPKVLNYLINIDTIDSSEIANLEMRYIHLLKYTDYQPKMLYKKLIQEPEFFVEVLCWVYRAKSKNNQETDQEVSEEARIKASIGYELLSEFNIIPGLEDNNNINETALEKWVNVAINQAIKADRKDIAHNRIGALLANSPKDPEDQMKPHRVIRDLIEKLESHKLQKGFSTRIYNSRGTVMKASGEGGAQERALSSQYKSWADSMKDQWSRTASIFYDLSGIYEREAKREDESS